MQYSGPNGISVELSNKVLRTFDLYRQDTYKKKESGGQLFARLNDGKVLICDATHPKSGDKQGRLFFLPNRRNEQKEIEQKHLEGLHYVGDWHTHPEAIPTPSSQDLISIAECFQESDHQLNYFIMIIVGTATFPQGLHISANSDVSHRLLLSK